VITNIHGVSGRAMLEAMISGQRDPKVLAQFARASMRTKIAVLEEALTGHFDEHHAQICRMMLTTIDSLTAQIGQLSASIEQAIAPFQAQVDRLDEIAGIGQICAQDIIAEIGVDMSRFVSAPHLVSWAKFCPQVNQSGGKPARNGATGHGNPWLAAALGESVIGASRTRTFLGERYRRLARRRGNKRALVGGWQLDAHGDLAPAVRPRSTLRRSRRLFLPEPHQRTTSAAEPHRPAGADHR